MANGRQRLSAICRPLAEPMTITYFSSRFSITVAVRPVSPIVRGSLGRKASSDKIDAKSPPAGAAVATAVMMDLELERLAHRIPCLQPGTPRSAQWGACKHRLRCQARGLVRRRGLKDRREEGEDVGRRVDELARRRAGAVAGTRLDPNQHGLPGGLGRLDRGCELVAVGRDDAIVVIARRDERRRILCTGL